MLLAADGVVEQGDLEAVGVSASGSEELGGGGGAAVVDASAGGGLAICKVGGGVAYSVGLVVDPCAERGGDVGAVGGADSGGDGGRCYGCVPAFEREWTVRSTEHY